MENLKVTCAQFENKSGDKEFNLSVIQNLSRQASAVGSKVIAFHECSITGYTFAQRLSRDELLSIAETIPDGPSIKILQSIAAEINITILAGLFEKDAQNNIYNTYICVTGTSVLAKYRKLHPFISKHLSPGNEYVTFDLHGWKCGILICYDNNVVENVRATALLGAQIIFMPHVTMCTPSTRPGAGFVSPALWENRVADPTSLRLEFDGLKGRAWLMKWLPARAYDNAIYVVFSNPIGMDDDQLKNGCSMIVDPFGDVIAENRELGNGISSAVLTSEKLELAGGKRYKDARRPELYGGIIAKSHKSELRVNWIQK
ncbi:Nitrilase/cyanide hydratase and apolipo protein N acyltransferase [Bisporella sp. PMI_857]|nr:Nitrilase/cyanide hydratase and apolipo protein N acyltransferase [Bisporella sp. PMI_857]